MTVKSCHLQLIAISACFILLCVLGIAWAITSGLLVSGIDGIMLLFICLLMAGIFALMVLLNLKQAGMLPAFGHAKSKAAAPADKPAAPASQPAPQGK